MKIVIVSSMQFYKKLLKIKKHLEKQKHKVIIPLPDNHYKNISDIKRISMNDFNKALKKSDAILVANFDKDSNKNYIGSNSLMEIGMAYILKKKIFILNEIPDNCKIELKAIKATELKNNLEKIK